jgi:hypothetical protein
MTENYENWDGEEELAWQPKTPKEEREALNNAPLATLSATPTTEQATALMHDLASRFSRPQSSQGKTYGLFVLWDASGKGRGGFSSAFSSGFDTFQLSVVLIQTFGAIYVLIRGLDNLVQGLPSETRAKFEARVREWHV